MAEHELRSRRLLRLALAVLAGAMLGFSFPPFKLGILACFALVPLLASFHGITRYRRALWHVYVAMFVFHAITINWTGGFVHANDPYMMIAGTVTIFVHPLFYFLPMGVYLLIRRHFSERLAVVLLPVLWVGYEYSHSLSEWSFPWLTLGNSQTYDLARIQFIEYTGVWGLSFWILVINALAYLLCLRLARGRGELRLAPARLLLAAVVLLYIAPEVHGLIVLARSEEPGAFPESAPAAEVFSGSTSSVAPVPGRAPAAAVVSGNAPAAEVFSGSTSSVAPVPGRAPAAAVVSGNAPAAELFSGSTSAVAPVPGRAPAATVVSGNVPAAEVFSGSTSSVAPVPGRAPTAAALPGDAPAVEAASASVPPLAAAADNAPAGALVSVSAPAAAAVPATYAQAVTDARGEYPPRLVTVGIIQSNVDPWDKWKASGVDTYSLYMRLTQQLMDSAGAPRPDIVLWPETAFPFDVIAPQNRELLSSLRERLGAWRVGLLTGLPHRIIYEDSSAAPYSARRDKRTGQRYDWFNAAAYIEHGTPDPVWYGKMKMVPFAERVPYADVFSFVDFLRWDVGIGGWQIGPDTTVFQDSRTGSRFSSIICYESTYPGFVAGFVRKGAEFIALITIDSWWGRMSGAFQHQQIAVLRAVENRRWIARCAVGGISCYIDPRGRAHQSTELFTQRVLSGRIERRNALTWYTAHADLFGEALLWLSLALAAAGVFQAFLKRKRKLR